MTERADLPRTIVLMALWHGGELVLQEWVRGGKEGLGFFGGKLKDGERPLDGALRETKQETGLVMRADEIGRLGNYQHDGWDIYAYQARLAIGTILPKVEGVAVYMKPLDAWKDKRLMPATRAVLRETIMIPNGIIDN